MPPHERGLNCCGLPPPRPHLTPPPQLDSEGKVLPGMARSFAVPLVNYTKRFAEGRKVCVHRGGCMAGLHENTHVCRKRPAPARAHAVRAAPPRRA